MAYLSLQHSLEKSVPFASQYVLATMQEICLNFNTEGLKKKKNTPPHTAEIKHTEYKMQITPELAFRQLDFTAGTSDELFDQLFQSGFNGFIWPSVLNQ